MHLIYKLIYIEKNAPENSFTSYKLKNLSTLVGKMIVIAMNYLGDPPGDSDLRVLEPLETKNLSSLVALASRTAVSQTLTDLFLLLG